MRLFTWLLCLIALVLLGTADVQTALAAGPKVVPVEVKPQTEPTPSTPGGKDEVYIYGGPGTLEGKFQTATLDPDPQGWTSHDLTVLTESPDEFQISTFYCANLDPGTPDNHAYWCGGYYTECVPGEDEGGYGNYIDAGLEWELAVDDPLVGTQVRIEYVLNYDTEEFYDYLHLEYWSEVSGGWSGLASYTGLGVGVSEVLNFMVQTWDYTADGKLKLRFRGESDYGLSSEDCWGGAFEGLCQIDNITVYFDFGAGPVAQGPTETCEPGDPSNWTMVNYYVPPPSVGNFAKVWPQLEEFEPPTLNTTPRWAFIDDGVVVPGLPGYTYGHSYGPGGFCVNPDGGLAGPGNLISNVVRSPHIAMPDGVWTEAYFEYEMFIHGVADGGFWPVFTVASVRSTDDPAGATGWTAWLNLAYYYGGPHVNVYSHDLATHLVPGCTFLQVSFGVIQLPGYPVNFYSSPAPYYDNAAVRLVGTPAAVPEAGISILPAASGPLNCDDTVLMTFQYTADAGMPDLFLYDAVVRASSELDFGVIESLYPFAGAGPEYFYAVDNGDNSWTITGSTVADPASPIVAPADVGLFTIVFDVVAQGTATVSFDQVVLRQADNTPIPGTFTGAVVTTDCTSPEAVTDLQAEPAHNKVLVSWQHDHADVDHYAVFRGLWYDGAPNNSAYPEYDDQPASTIPTRPVDYAAAVASAEWQPAGTAPAGDLVFVDDGMATGRGVYYYEVFAVDLAFNASARSATNDRATNYWLGDVDPEDGQVNPMDMNFLGARFGDAVPLDDPSNVADVGPTDDWSSRGIPLTDSVIDFEDLMVFALNFGVVTPAKREYPVSSSAVLAWMTLEDGRQVLQLLDGRGIVGLRVRSRAPIDLLSVEAGALLGEQTDPVFLRNVGDDLDLSVAVMGRGPGFAGQGDLFVIRTAEPMDPAAIDIEVRGLDNTPLEIVMSTDGQVPLPHTFALYDAYPNPFNPNTLISYSLANSRPVRLSVYGLDGREICTLVDETQSPGRHEVVWTGCDSAGRLVASGTYFYRLAAGDFRQVRKMTLMK